jgi:hypothetical protein
MKNIKIVSRIHDDFSVSLCQDCYSYAHALKVDRNVRSESTSAPCELCNLTNEEIN